jgi:hypothetical protein
MCISFTGIASFSRKRDEGLTEYFQAYMALVELTLLGFVSVFLANFMVIVMAL